MNNVSRFDSKHFEVRDISNVIQNIEYVNFSWIGCFTTRLLLLLFLVCIKLNPLAQYLLFFVSSFYAYFRMQLQSHWPLPCRHQKFRLSNETHHHRAEAANTRPLARTGVWNTAGIIKHSSWCELGSSGFSYTLVEVTLFVQSRLQGTLKEPGAEKPHPTNRHSSQNANNPTCRNANVSSEQRHDRPLTGLPGSEKCFPDDGIARSSQATATNTSKIGFSFEPESSLNRWDKVTKFTNMTFHLSEVSITWFLNHGKKIPV